MRSEKHPQLISFNFMTAINFCATVYLMAIQPVIRIQLHQLIHKSRQRNTSKGDRIFKVSQLLNLILAISQSMMSILSGPACWIRAMTHEFKRCIPYPLLLAEPHPFAFSLFSITFQAYATSDILLLICSISKERRKKLWFHANQSRGRCGHYELGIIQIRSNSAQRSWKVASIQGIFGLPGERILSTHKHEYGNQGMRNAHVSRVLLYTPPEVYFVEVIIGIV